MQTEIKTRRIYLNSNSPQASKLNSSYNSAVKFNIPTLSPARTEDMLYCKVKISNVQIPYSYYIIGNSNDLLIVDNVSYYLNHGNYNAYTLITELIRVLPTSFSVSFDTQTGLLTFTNISSMTIRAASTCSKILGIGENDLIGSTITLPNMLNVIRTKVLYIKILELSLDTLDTITGDQCTILAVPVNTEPFGLIEKDNSSAEGYNSSVVGIDHLTIEIRDDSGNLVDFNDQNWTISLQIDCYYPYFYQPRQTFGEIIQAKLNPPPPNNIKQ